MPTTWTIAVDWDRSGSYTDTYDDISAYVIEATWYLGMKKPYQTIADNSVLALTLNNSDRRFSPEYIDSPLYGSFLPMRPIQVKAGDTVMWEGWLESLKPVPGRYGQRITHMMAHGPMPIYMDAEAKIDLQENKRTDEIILDLIREVVVPPAGSNAWMLGGAKLGIGTYLLPASAYSDLETGQVTLDLAADNWVKDGGRRDEDQDVFDVYRAISDVANVEDGKFFVDRDGTAVFWNRHHVMDYDSSTMSPDCTLNDQMMGMEYTYMSLDAVKNDIIVTCHPRTVSTETDVTLWGLTDGQTIRVDSDDEYDLEIRYTDDSDNRIGGRSVTYSNLEFDSRGASASLTVEAKANGAKLRFSNTSDQPAVVTGLKIVGQKITDEGAMDATASDGAYTTHRIRVGVRHEPASPLPAGLQYRPRDARR
jgi:hypothetical protein